MIAPVRGGNIHPKEKIFGFIPEHSPTPNRMTTKIHNTTLALAAALLSLGTSLTVQAQVANEGLANSITAARQKNAQMMQQYSWNSRMESSGLPDRIQVTDAMEQALSDQFDFEERGEVEIKGKGLLRTSFLLGRKHS